MSRGYFGIGLENSKHPVNLGSLWRTAYNMQANFIFTINQRYKSQKSDTVKAWRHLPFYEYQTVEQFQQSIPRECNIVGVEITAGAHSLFNFVHPERAIYLLGPEDGSISPTAQKFCHSIVYIPTNLCMNVANAGAIVMYDRILKGQKVI